MEQRRSLKVKICGVCTHFSELFGLDVDYLGLNFYRDSPRYIGASCPAEFLEGERGSTKLVGVFVNAPLDEVLATIDTFRLSVVQLHGDEERNYIRELRSRSGVSVWKAVGVTSEGDFEQLYDCEPDVELFVLDSRSTGYGGSGKKFDWQLLGKLEKRIPFLLSGGIRPEDASAIRKMYERYSNLVGIDVNSGFEVCPGEKSLELLNGFLEELRG